MIEGADLDEPVRASALAVYRRLAEIEGAIHGMDPDDVELHEVGALDSILDVVGVCAALHDLGVTADTDTPPAVVTHGFTHFIWHLQPLWCTPVAHATPLLREPEGAWHTMGSARALGLPAPIRRLLHSIEEPPE